WRRSKRMDPRRCLARSVPTRISSAPAISMATGDPTFDDPASGTRAFFVDEIGPELTQHLIAVRGANWIVEGIGDFNGDDTIDILQHQINGGNATLRALSMNAVQVQSAPILGGVGPDWQVDGTGDFNGDGTSDILVHQDSSSGVRTLQVLTVQNNAIVSGTTIAHFGTNISVGGIGDFNNNGTSDILVHQDVGTTRTDIVYNVVNNTVVNTHTVAVTGIDWHVA